jgi:hypothetical protein
VDVLLSSCHLIVIVSISATSDAHVFQPVSSCEHCRDEKDLLGIRINLGPKFGGRLACASLLLSAWAEVLLAISRESGESIEWLLTGEG